MNDVTIEKAYATALAAYAMATALQNTVLNTKELRATYLKELRKQIQDLGLSSAEVKTEIERILSRQTVQPLLVRSDLSKPAIPLCRL